MLAKIPYGLDEIIDVFGSLDDPDFEDKNIVKFDLPYTLIYNHVPVNRAKCHFLAVDNFVEAFNRIAAADLTEHVKNYGGIFCKRPIRGHWAHPSTHSWGIAIDIEPNKYPLGSKDRLPDEVIKIFNECGFFYGGDFKSRKDPMHFQLCRGY